jgi:hypothetical protein
MSFVVTRRNVLQGFSIPVHTDEVHRDERGAYSSIFDRLKLVLARITVWNKTTLQFSSL